MIARRWGAKTGSGRVGVGLTSLAMEDVCTTQLFRAAGCRGAVDPQLDAGWLLALLHQAARVDGTTTWGPPSKQEAIGARLDPTVTVGGLAGESVFGFFGNSSPGPLEPRGSRFDQIERHINKQPHTLVAATRPAGLHAMTEFYGLGTPSWPCWP